ncbi:MAG: NAD-dependent succinate-semialdehyde dehydrogenase [Proteobacteria bacterium]|nr:NAD-dependent succinate-semialdehyde dehydrogenase [Pseudomonadota bacterium]
MQSTNPATGTPYLDHELHSEAEVRRRLTLATGAQKDWSQTSFSHRAGILNSIADALEASVDDHAPAMTREMGKPIAESEGELRKCAWVCRYYAEHAGTFLAPEAAPADVESTDTFVRFDPLGVVLAVMPWNFPWWQVFRFGAPALMAGNAMLMKHAPNTQDQAARIERLCLAAGLPEGLLQMLVTDNDGTGQVLADPAVAAVTLTGSDRAGRAVASLAGQHLKKAVLELGGSDPFIVLDDADVEAAVREGVRSRCLNNGQSCIAAKRFLVQDGVYDEFVERIVATMGTMAMGDPTDRGIELGPLAREDLRDELQRQVHASAFAGARIRCGGMTAERPGWFFPATVLTDLTVDMPVWREETFGPVAAVHRIGSVEEAVGLANDSRYGLGASLFTADLERARDVAAQLEVGAVFVNRMTASDPRVPFGGVKESGYGRELGSFGIREFVNVKTVWIA